MVTRRRPRCGRPPKWAPPIAGERRAFGIPTGTYQAVAHPFADALVAKDGAHLLAWNATWALETDHPDERVVMSITIVVTGTASGLGKATVEKFARERWNGKGHYEPIDMHTAFSTSESSEKIMAMIRGFTKDLVLRDASAFVDYLDSLPEKTGSVGTTGYCLGGRLSLLVAANLGERISAAASFHGGNLANADDPDVLAFQPATEFESSAVCIPRR